MRIEPVERLPERQPNTPKKRLRDIVEEFIKMNVKYAELEFNSLEYSSARSANDALNLHILRRTEYPVKSKFINGRTYLIRTDMED